MSKSAILKTLRDPQSRGRLVFHVPAGGEVRQALVDHLVAVGKAKSCLVLTHSQLRNQLWVVALRRAATKAARQVNIVDVANGFEDVFAFADRSESVIAVSTVPRIRNGLGVRLIRSFDWEVIVFDEVSGGMPRSVDGLSDLARVAVAVVDGTAELEWSGSQVAAPLTEEQFDQSVAGVQVEMLGYDTNLAADNRIGEIRSSLRALLPDIQSPLEDLSTAALHQVLVRLASASHTQPYEGNSLSGRHTEALWRLADELEALADGPLDARLDAIARIVNDAAPGWVVVATARADIALIADRLRRQGNDVAILSAELSLPDRLDILRDPPAVVVMSTPMAVTPGVWPSRYNGIWWSPPRDRNDYERRMLRIADANGARAVFLGQRRPPD